MKFLLEIFKAYFILGFFWASKSHKIENFLIKQIFR